MTSCFFCSESLPKQALLSIPESPFTDSFSTSTEQAKNCFREEIKIFQCKYCGSVQNPFPLCSQDYYYEYEYTSSRSPLVATFMQLLAEECFDIFLKLNVKHPKTVIEPGSGDGFQLNCFKRLGLSVQGVEPSHSLTEMAETNGCKTICSVFDEKILNYIPDEKFDILLSSYTFDHSPNPLQFLRIAYDTLQPNGILCLEVHDISKIKSQCEFSLFEHEHTIYLNAEQLILILETAGFKAIKINPIPTDKTRANSLIVIAKKMPEKNLLQAELIYAASTDISGIQNQFYETIARIDRWVASRIERPLVGYGAGGRGVMTLAQLKESSSFEALLDISYSNSKVFSPLTGIPVVGPDKFSSFSNYDVLVFSFGYFDEIVKNLVSIGYQKNQIFNYLDIA